MLSLSFYLPAQQEFVTQGPSTAPLEMRHGVPFVRLMVDGKGPYVFAVDTGTNNQAIVSPELAEKLHLPVVAERHLTDLAGRSSQTVREVSIASVNLAGREFPGVRAIVHGNVSGMGAYDGVLGIAFFRDVLLTLDFPNRRLQVSDARLDTAKDTIPMRYWQGVPALMLQLGETQMEAQIDTGATALSLPASVVGSQKFSGGLEVYGRGSSQVQSWALRGGSLKGSIEMAGYTFKDPYVEVNDHFPVANLGTAPLQNFVLQLDQRSRLIAFRADGRMQRLERATLQASMAPPAGTTMMPTHQYSGGY